MTDLTNVATILTAFRDLLHDDLLHGESMFRERSVQAVDKALRDLSASGLVRDDQVTNYGADREFRSDFAHALFGADRCIAWALAGKL